MHKHAISIGAFALAALTGYACGGGDDTGPHRTEVVQIANVGFPQPDAICTDPAEGSEISYQLEFYIEMVNTTKDSVTVTGVSSTGIVFGASRPTDITNPATPAHVFGILPYEPNPVGLRAHDGDVTLHITMRVPCGTELVTTEYSKTILTTLYVTTNRGQYATNPLPSHITWKHLVPVDTAATR
jgi:hypothetical protein